MNIDPNRVGRFETFQFTQAMFAGTATEPRA
jgi:hypothetical protein